MKKENKKKGIVRKIMFWVLLIITAIFVIASISSMNEPPADKSIFVIMTMMFLFPWAIYALVKLIKIEKKRRIALTNGITTCADCGKEISKTASKCPHCGKRISNQALGFLIMLIGIIILVIAVVAII